MSDHTPEHGMPHAGASDPGLDAASEMDSPTPRGLGPETNSPAPPPGVSPRQRLHDAALFARAAASNAQAAVLLGVQDAGRQLTELRKRAAAAFAAGSTAARAPADGVHGPGLPVTAPAAQGASAVPGACGMDNCPTSWPVPRARAPETRPRGGGDDAGAGSAAPTAAAASSPAKASDVLTDRLRRLARFLPAATPAGRSAQTLEGSAKDEGVAGPPVVVRAAARREDGAVAASGFHVDDDLGYPAHDPGSGPLFLAGIAEHVAAAPKQDVDLATADPARASVFHAAGSALAGRVAMPFARLAGGFGGLSASLMAATVLVLSIGFWAMKFGAAGLQDAAAPLAPEPSPAPLGFPAVDAQFEGGAASSAATFKQSAQAMHTPAVGGRYAARRWMGFVCRLGNAC